MKTWKLTQPTNDKLINYLQSKPFSTVNLLLEAAAKETEGKSEIAYSGAFVDALSQFLGQQSYKEVFVLVNDINLELAPQATAEVVSEEAKA